MKDFCNHIIDCEYLSQADNVYEMRMWAVDPKFVQRKDFDIVCGWYTWLCMDMSCGRVMDQSQLEGVTTTSKVDFHAMYRTSEVLVKNTLVNLDHNNYTMQLEMFSGTRKIATGEFVFKVRKIK